VAYTLPDWNIAADWWQVADLPTTNPPTIAAYPAQMYYATRTGFAEKQVLSVADIRLVEFRVKIGFIVAVTLPIVGSVFQILDAAGNKWNYLVQYWDYVHFGFPNEYVALLCCQCDTAGTPPDTAR